MIKVTITRLAFVFTFAAVASCFTGLLQAQDKSKPTLYERLGRYDAIARITDDYLKGIRADPQLARFIGRSSDSLVRARQLLKDQLCALTGGPCAYIGRDMKTVHGGLGITESDWALSMKYMTAALDKSHITGGDKDDFLALIESMRKQIVEKAGY
jgi:hemoglobin